jgi:DNA-binding SARP family transcriptional activator
MAGDAVLYATLAIGAQPMRESAHQALLRAHICQGNRFEALQHYSEFTQMLERELGVPPSPETSAIMAGLDEESA